MITNFDIFVNAAVSVTPCSFGKCMEIKLPAKRTFLHVVSPCDCFLCVSKLVYTCVIVLHAVHLLSSLRQD